MNSQNLVFPPSDLYHEGRQHAQREDLRQWLDHLLTTPSERVRQLRDLRTETFQSAYGFLPYIQPPGDGVDRSKEDIIVGATVCLAQVFLTAETIPYQGPPALKEYKEGWVLDAHDDEDYQMYAEHVNVFDDYKFLVLRGFLDIDQLPIVCTESDCHCVVQQAPIGDRGGLARRVPCAHRALFRSPNMRLVKRQFVSIF